MWDDMDFDFELGGVHALISLCSILFQTLLIKVVVGIFRHRVHPALEFQGRSFSILTQNLRATNKLHSGINSGKRYR